MTVSKKSLANLKPPFKKGGKRASECAKKQKRGVSLKRALRELFESEAKKKGKSKKEIRITAENFVRSCALHGMKGNPGYAKMIFEYIDGKVPDEMKGDLNCNVKIIKKRG